MPNISIILLEDIAQLGRAGDIVATSEGYARNFLFPQGKAALATPDVRQREAVRQTKIVQTKQVELAQLQAQAEQLTGTELTINVRVKEGEDIYGSVTKKNIAEELQEQAQLTLKPSQIELKKPLTKLGSQEVTIRLSPEVETTIRVTVEDLEA